PAAVDPAAADEADRWAHAGDAVPDRRAADRGETLLPNRNGAEIGRDAGARTAGRAAGGALEVVDVAGRAKQRAVGVAAAKLAERGFAEEDDAGTPQLGDDE